MAHECKYAEAIRKPVYFIENEDGVELCGFCHAKNEPEQKAPAKSVRK